MTTRIARLFLLAVILAAPCLRAASDEAINLFETWKWQCGFWDPEARQGGKAGDWVSDPVKVGPNAFQWNAFMGPQSYLCRAQEKIEGAPLDLSGFDTLHFWMHSKSATDQKIMLSIITTSQDTGDAQYLYPIAVDWEGWKEFNISFEEMKRFNHPDGWKAIKDVMFGVGGWGTKTAPGTVLTIDDLKAIKTQ